MFNKKIYNIVLYYWLLQIFLIICQLFAGDELPEWVKNRRDTHFPEGLYIQAVGQATKSEIPDKDRANAEADAHNQIAQQLYVSISSKTIIQKSESQSGNIIQEQSSEEILASTQITLSGLRIEKYYFDKKQKNYYVLAVLDRRIAVSAIYNEILALKNGAGGALQIAANLADSCKPLQSILNIRRAYQLLQAVNDRQQILSVLQTPLVSIESIPAQPDIEQVLQMLDKAVRSVRIENLSVTTTMTTRSQLPLMIKVRAEGRNLPLVNMALVCFFRKGRGSASARGRTDNEGCAQIAISELGPAINGDYTIEVLPDISELFLKDGQTGMQEWNLSVQHALQPASMSLKRSDVDLTDYCAGVATNLVERLTDDGIDFQLAFGNITYAETGAASAFIAYLKDQIAVELALQPKVKLIARDKLEQSLRDARISYRGNKRPDHPEILADLVAADGILTGTYWERTDMLECNFQIIQSLTGKALAATIMKIPKTMIPSNFPYLPANYSIFSDVRQLDNLKTFENGLNVEVWVDRGDGAIYRVGEKVTIFVRATQDCYLYLIYHDAGGNDVLIYPNTRQLNNRILGGVIYQIPDARDSFDFTVQNPFGSELLKAIVGKELLPDLPGKMLSNGLKLLTGTYKDTLIRLRGITIQARPQGYSEGSCVMTTTE